MCTTTTTLCYYKCMDKVIFYSSRKNIHLPPCVACNALMNECNWGYSFSVVLELRWCALVWLSGVSFLASRAVDVHNSNNSNPIPQFCSRVSLTRPIQFFLAPALIDIRPDCLARKFRMTLKRMNAPTQKSNAPKTCIHAGCHSFNRLRHPQNEAPKQQLSS